MASVGEIPRHNRKQGVGMGVAAGLCGLNSADTVAAVGTFFSARRLAARFRVVMAVRVFETRGFS
jgi:hypothetical protein